MLDRSGLVLDRGPKYETGIFKVVWYFGGPGLNRGPERSKAVWSASLIKSPLAYQIKLTLGYQIVAHKMNIIQI